MHWRNVLPEEPTHKISNNKDIDHFCDEYLQQLLNYFFAYSIYLKIRTTECRIKNEQSVK